MYGAKWTHGLWFLAITGRWRKMPSCTQYTLYTASTLFVLSGTFYGAEALPSLVGTSYIANPTSSWTKTDKFLSSTTSFSISSTSDTSTCSSKGPSLNNMCLSLSVVIQKNCSRVNSSIGASPSQKYWWLKMMHPASFWRVFFIFWQRKTEFLSLWPLSVFGYFFLMCLEECTVWHNIVISDPFTIVSLLWVIFLQAKIMCLLITIKWPPSFDIPP